jgi:hypothetical protein
MADAAVEAFEPAAGEAEADGGEHAGSLGADGARESHGGLESGARGLRARALSSDQRIPFDPAAVLREIQRYDLGRLGR